MVYVVGALAIMMLVQSWFLWRMARALRPLQHYAERIGQLSGALHLLTETAEAGFGSFAGVLNEAIQPSPKRRAPRRPRTAAVRSADTVSGPAPEPHRSRTPPRLMNAPTPQATSEGALRMHLSEADHGSAARRAGLEA